MSSIIIILSREVVEYAHGEDAVEEVEVEVEVEEVEEVEEEVVVEVVVKKVRIVAQEEVILVPRPAERDQRTAVGTKATEKKTDYTSF
ncbi:hypothetical protein FHG87_020849 [Trinorchestia longiramus]|nr:hypothetical protein FHG87_020849 [Trinorchestia longiramus]